MHEIYQIQWRHLLYRSLDNNHFILTNFMSIYPFNEQTLAVNCWHRRTYLALKEKGLIIYERENDEKFYYFRVKVEHLQTLIECGSPKRRIHRHGKKLKRLEEILGHKIIPYSPVIFWRRPR